MANKQLLTLVEDKDHSAVPLRRVVGDFWESSKREIHSLHGIIPYRNSFRPELVDFCLRKYSSKGSVVCDPFCGRGTTGLQANLLGRVALMGDLNPLSVFITRAKLLPVGLDEVVLRLNEVDFGRPVDLSEYQDAIFPFYHPDTYRELMNLRAFVRRRADRVNDFVQLLALSRLHGHMPGYFSVYTAPQTALSPERQLQLNLRRRQSPEYRAVAPRIIRRAAQVLQDGFSSDFFEMASKSEVHCSDARRLHWASANSVDLVITAPPLLEEYNPVQDNWLDYWFSGVPTSTFLQQMFSSSDVYQYRDFIRATLRELLRVLRPDGYAAVVVGDLETATGTTLLDEVVSTEAQAFELMGKRFRVEEVLIQQQRVAERVSSEASRATANNRVVILRVSNKHQLRTSRGARTSGLSSSFRR